MSAVTNSFQRVIMDRLISQAHQKLNATSARADNSIPSNLIWRDTSTYNKAPDSSHFQCSPALPKHTNKPCCIWTKQDLHSEVKAPSYLFGTYTTKTRRARLYLIEPNSIIPKSVPYAQNRRSRKMH